MKIGYAGISTDDQNLDLQMDALTKTGCERIFTDQGMSGRLSRGRDYPRRLVQSGRVMCWGVEARPPGPIIELSD